MLKSREIKEEARASLQGKRGKAGSTYLIYCLATVLLSVVFSFLPLKEETIDTLVTIFDTIVIYGCIVVLIKLKRNEEVSPFNCIPEGIKKFGKVLMAYVWVIIKLLPWIAMTAIGIIMLGLSTFLHSSAILEYSSATNMSEIVSVFGIVLMIAGAILSVIMGIKYSLIHFIIHDNPDTTGHQAVNESAKIMKGKISNMICLYLSFIPEILLVVLVAIVPSFFIGNELRYFLMGFDNNFDTKVLISIIILIANAFATMFYLVPYIQMSNICFYEEAIKENSEAINETTTEMI